ncbi:hypothetical protein ADH76_01385 [Enterocloster clostridioformis]|nr:hypothetical protein A4V08_35425 [Lachnoclostridium sp. YL32]NDO27679.1 cyclic lactone autoinducer peptide [Enterocloster clostridioformis]OXE70143.1 hypothetical protein ADH76_01385 [Enterocloster clostridioformis]QQR00286.1 cyclic lactone autoinducer peptide [Enterocloster clostridioformis]
MSYLAKFIELCAIFGANCASMCTSYQPKLPKSLM